MRARNLYNCYLDKHTIRTPGDKSEVAPMGKYDTPKGIC